MTLSPEDFQRMQETLLELKGRNYSLEEQARKQKNALGEAEARVKVLDQELAKATKVIEKSKKISEVQRLMHDNDIAGRKLISQEEEWRLQNQTLLEELQKLVLRNEELEAEQEKVGKRQLDMITDEFSMEDEDDESERDWKAEAKEATRRLQEERNEVAELRSTKEQLKAKQDELVAERDASRKEKEARAEECTSLRTKLTGAEKKLSELREQLRKREEDWTAEENGRRREEKEREARRRLEEEDQEKQRTIEDEEKERKSQEKIAGLFDQAERLKAQLKSCQRQLAEVTDRGDGEREELEKRLKIAEEALARCPEMEFRRLEGAEKTLKVRVETAEINAEKAELEVEKGRIEFQRLAMEVMGLRGEREEMSGRLEAALLEAEQVKQMSEKRKNMLDEMAIEMQKKCEELLEVEKSKKEDRDELNGQLEEEKRKSEDERNKKEHELSELKARLGHLEGVEGKCNMLRMEVEKEKEGRKVAEEEVVKGKEELARQEKEQNKKLEESLQEREREKQVSILEWSSKCSDLETQLELAAVQKEEVEEMVKKLQQEARDGVEEKKIGERKSVAMVKDLKRQLQAERRKAEKLQERLQEWAEAESNSEHTTPVSTGHLDPDRSSISSWSLMSGQGGDQGPTSSSSPLPSSTPSPPGEVAHGSNPRMAVEKENGTLEKDNQALMDRVAMLQQEKWALEEKLVMLEQSGAAMADELVIKSELVKQYCMTGQQGKRSTNNSNVSSPFQPERSVSHAGRLMKEKLDRLVNKENQQHVQEVSSMQAMLEETLTKNLHLQKDLEHMSQEVVRLSKLAASPTKP